MGRNEKSGIPLALFSIVMWAGTYVSTKVLVQTFSPLEISLVRFTIGLVVMHIIAPPWRMRRNASAAQRRFRITLRSEARIAAAGVMGMFLYYFLENLAAEYTYASNVSIIVTTIPLWTGLLGCLTSRNERFHRRYIGAFLLSMGGLIVLLAGSGGSAGVSLSGDLAALGASMVFAMYTVILRGVDSCIPALHLTRKTLVYGWIVIAAVCAATGRIPAATEVIRRQNFPHFLFLGIVASALCFVTWALAIRRLGAVRASQFIYLVPFVTVSMSAAILGEPLDARRITGLVCIVCGVAVSQMEDLPGRIGKAVRRRERSNREAI